jgi:hypothetical protein
LMHPTEWFEFYHPGGLHPLHLGDIFTTDDRKFFAK